MEDVIIGSGPSGISAAWALIKQGRNVTMLDVGEELEPENESLRSKLASDEPNQWQIDDINLYTSLKRSGNIDGATPYGSDLLFRDSVHFFDDEQDNNPTGLKPSFAKGGLSNGWGSAILPYRQEDMTDWPESVKELSSHYEAIREFMPMAAKVDDLHALFPMQKIAENSSLPLSSQAKALLDRLNKKKEKLNQSSIYFGQARQAASSKDCRKCGMCLYGCPYGIVYNTRQTLAKLLKSPSFKYKKGYYVERLEERKDQVQLLVQDTSNNQELLLSAKRVFVACGVLPTSKLILNSLEYYNKPILIKDSQQFFLPLLHTWHTGKNPSKEETNSLVQLFIEILDPNTNEKTSHIQIYTFNDLYALDIRKRFGHFSKFLKPLINLLSQRLIVAQGFLHSDHSDGIEVRLNKNGDNTSLQLKKRNNNRSARAVSTARNKLSKLALMSGLLPLLPLIRYGNVGSSFHCGSTFPMRDNPTGIESDTLGRPAGLKRVFIVDASVLPSIPATTITLSVMANAHRIAMESTNIID